MSVKLLSHVRLLVTPWTVAHQAPLSMEFFRQEYWSGTGVGCYFLLQGIFLIQGLNPGLPHCRQMLYRLSHQGIQSLQRQMANAFGKCQFVVDISDIKWF